MRNRVLVLLAAATLILVGCKDVQHKGGADLANPYRTFVCLAPGGSEIVAGLLGTSYKVLGRTESCNYPPTVTASPVVTIGVKPNYEKIAQLKPQCVIYDHSLFSKEDIAKIEQLGFPTVDIYADTIDQYFDILQTLGAKTRNEMIFSEYADRVQKIRVLKAATVKNPVSCAVVMPSTAGEHYICGTDGIVADCVKAVGGIPVGPAGTGFIQMNAEALIRLNPDVIYTSGSPLPFTKDPRFIGLKAVKTGNVVGITEDLILRRGSRMDKLLEAMSGPTG